MNSGYVFLTEKEEMWAKLLMQVLEDHAIPHVALPVFGAGFTLKTGTQERLKIHVPATHFAQATALIEELFSAESVIGDE